MVVIQKERKDPADIAKDFIAKMDESEPKKPEAKDPEAPKDEKPTQQGAEPSPDKDAVEQPEEVPEDKEKEEVVEDKDKVEDEGKEGKPSKRNPQAEKRIDELVSELKMLREENNSKDKEYTRRIEALEVEKTELQRKAGIAPENKVASEVESLERKRIQQYLEEDKALPRERRREMTKAEYEEWLIDDMTSATDWRVEQRIRQREERKEDEHQLKVKAEVERVSKSQETSRLRVEARHPELAIDDVRAKLKAEGMSDKAIAEKLYKENPKYRVIADIIRDDREKAQEYMLLPNGPELLEAEMVKRLAASGDKKAQDAGSDKLTILERQIAELQEELNLEKSRSARVDVGVTSKKGAGKMATGNTKANAELDNVLKLLKNKGKGMTREEYAAMLERRSNIRGADGGNDEKRDKEV